eukprot:9007793-Karenia_brevis.AAC.1
MSGAQVVSRSHKHDDGTSGWQKALGRSKLLRKYTAWGEKVLWVPGGKKRAFFLASKTALKRR